KGAVVSSNLSRQPPLHCIATGISPLALRNDIVAFNYRTQIIQPHRIEPVFPKRQGWALLSR
ncbi:MAG: hypothetical protein KDI02_25165, partial [Anaerolineae bacterium]|nr:hypothetical protein [Anaerolineae bacterium]